MTQAVGSHSICFKLRKIGSRYKPWIVETLRNAYIKEKRTHRNETMTTDTILKILFLIFLNGNYIYHGIKWGRHGKRIYMLYRIVRLNVYNAYINENR